MQRKTIPEKGPDEEEDLSPHDNGRLIAEYNDLESSYERGSFSGQEAHEQSCSIRSLRKSSKGSSSGQRKRAPRDASQNRSNKRPNKEFISTGYRLNDFSRIDDYQSRRDTKVNINSFLNSHGDRSSFLQEDRLRAFSKENQPKRKSPQAFELPADKPIELITIPEVDPEAAQFEYLAYLNRHNKIPRRDDYFRGLIDFNRHLQRYEDVHSTSFQQAKLKFYDRFMPEPLKIARNPYRLLQYNQCNKSWRNMLERL